MCIATRPRVFVGIPLAHGVKAIFRQAFSSVEATAVVKTGAKFAQNLAEMSSQEAEPAITSASDLAAILFTSGSTGAPKGGGYEHAMFEAQVEMIRGAYAIEPGEVDLPMLPIFALFNPAMGMTTVVPEMNPVGQPSPSIQRRLCKRSSKTRLQAPLARPYCGQRLGATYRAQYTASEFETYLDGGSPCAACRHAYV